jgi:ABC-type lipoprotein release transport system permease subunit
MTLGRLLLRNLLYHWRGNLAVLLGVAVGTAVLTGALLVGDSLRGSLRERTLRQLEWVEHALVAGRFVRQDLAMEISAAPVRPAVLGLGDTITSERVEPAIILQGSASTIPPEESATIPQRVGRVTVYGIDEGIRSELPTITTENGAVINATLAKELGVGVGDKIALNVQKATGVPRETLLGRRDTESVVSRMTVSIEAVLADDAPYASFNLNPSPVAPRNVFVALPCLQTNLDQKARVNALLVGDAGLEQLREDLRKNLTLEDLGLVVRSPQGRTDELFRRLDRDHNGRLTPEEYRGQIAGIVVATADTNGDGMLTRDEILAYYRKHHDYVSLESRQMLLEPAVFRSFPRLLENGPLYWHLNPALPDWNLYRTAPTLAYLANTIAANGQEIPYSVVAALDPLQLLFGPFLLPGANILRDDEIVLADWKESPLRVKPGDAVTLTYFEPVQEGQVHEKTAVFRFRGYVPMQGAAADPGLTPEFPGITDKLDIRKWDPPFPYDNTRIKDRDERYWKKYRTTPKAYITLRRGQELWGSRFGQLTSIRIGPPLKKAPPADWAEQLANSFRMYFPNHLDPEKAGLVFDPVRERALESSTGSTDFEWLFLGFSFFLIVAALLLVGMLFRLNLDRRASEVGLLFAAGYRRWTVAALLLGEGGVLAGVGALVGTCAAVSYAWFLLELLRAWWPGGLERSFLTLHPSATSLVIGHSASVLVSGLTIAAAVWSFSRVAPRTLLAGDTSGEADPSTPRRRPRWSVYIAIASTLGALLLIGLSGFVRDHEMRAMTFFGGGTLLLTAALAATWAWMRGSRHGNVTGHGLPALTRLGVRNGARNPLRSLLSVGLLASAAFLIVAVESFRRTSGKDFFDKNSGSGGFTLLAESDVPLFQDLNADKGREDVVGQLQIALQEVPGLDGEQVRQRVNAAREQLKGVEFFSFRVRGGDDASCLNLYQPRRPRLLGVPPALIERGGFRFSDTLAQTEEERANPWLLLNRDDDAVPVIGDANTVTWMLKSKLGGELEVPDEHGDKVKLRIVGLLQDSICQSGLLMSEKHFLKLYPSQEGYSFFLIDTKSQPSEGIKDLLTTALAAQGVELTSTAARLESYLAVENTYLSTFQALGGLGLLLGAIGLAVVLLRGVWERRGELALLRALGYRHKALGWLVLAENVFLLLLGLGAGTVCALLAVGPHLLGGGGAVPWQRLLGMLGAVLLTGLVTAAAALAVTLRAPLLPALRRE